MLDGGEPRGTWAGGHASRQGSEERRDGASKGDACQGEAGLVRTDGSSGEGHLLRKLANDVDQGQLNFAACRNVVSLAPTKNEVAVQGVHARQSSSDLQPNGSVEA